MHTYACMHVGMYACMFVCLHVCMFVCLFVCTFVCLYVCMFVCLYVCMFVCLYACWCLRDCMLAWMHARPFACMHLHSSRALNGLVPHFKLQVLYVWRRPHFRKCQTWPTWNIKFCTNLMNFVITQMHICRKLRTHDVPNRRGLFVCMFESLFACVYVYMHARVFVCIPTKVQSTCTWITFEVSCWSRNTLLCIHVYILKRQHRHFLGNIYTRVTFEISNGFPTYTCIFGIVLYIYICTYIYTYENICLFGIVLNTHTHTHTHIYIYIYIYYSSDFFVFLFQINSHMREELPSRSATASRNLPNACDAPVHTWHDPFIRVKCRIHMCDIAH